MEPKFSLESEGAVAGSSAKWLVSCWQQMGATALFVSVAFWVFLMYFSQLDLKSLLVGNLGCVNCRPPCAKADQPQDQCSQGLWELAPKPWRVSFRPRQPIG